MVSLTQALQDAAILSPTKDNVHPRKCQEFDEAF